MAARRWGWVGVGWGGWGGEGDQSLGESVIVLWLSSPGTAATQPAELKLLTFSLGQVFPKQRRKPTISAQLLKHLDFIKS